MTVIPLLAPRSTTREDVELVRACAQGDQLALAELHRRFAAQLWRFLSRLLGLGQGQFCLIFDLSAIFQDFFPV
mgnify:CR=1 FL=1